MLIFLKSWLVFLTPGKVRECVSDHTCLCVLFIGCLFFFFFALSKSIQNSIVYTQLILLIIMHASSSKIKLLYVLITLLTRALLCKADFGRTELKLTFKVHPYPIKLSWAPVGLKDMIRYLMHKNLKK